MGLLPRDEDEHLASVWLAHFGSPIPVHGASSIARRILLEHGVKTVAVATEQAFAEVALTGMVQCETASKS